MRTRSWVVGLLAVVIMLIAAPAAACTPHRMKATMDGMTIGFDPDPTVVAERCPEGFEWILQTGGTMHLKSAVYHGDVEFLAEHCSRWVTPPGERALGEVGGGLMTLMTPDGDELWLGYHGHFEFRGDVETEWISRVRGRYLVIGGTGVFEGAEGRGRMALTDETNIQSGRWWGALFVER